MSRNRLTLLIAVALVILALGWVIGRRSGIITFGEGPCRTDKLKFCKDVPNKTDVGACLQQHAAELTETCKAKLEAKAKQKEAKAKEAKAKKKEPEEHTAP
jgi:hypothetical protein